MEAPKFFAPKFVRYVKGLHVLLLALALAACGDRKPSAGPQPCGLGVNASQCSLTLNEHTTWTTQFTSSRQDSRTKATIPGSEKKITVLYEFKPQAPHNLWRRSLIVESQDGTVATYQQGEVIAMDAVSMNLAIEQTACDDSSYTLHSAATRQLLYYSRTGANLNLDTEVIVKKSAHTIGDLFGNMFAEIVVDVLRTTLEQAFSLGSASTYLTSGHGNFTLEPTSTLELFQTKSAKVGCFSSLGSGFENSSLSPNW